MYKDLGMTSLSCRKLCSAATSVLRQAKSSSLLCYVACERSLHTQIVILSDSQRKQLQRLSGLPVVHHHGYVCELPPNHRFPMPKFHGVFRYLVSDGVISPDKQTIEPQQVSEDLACTVHTKEYVKKFFTGKTSESEQRVTGFRWSEGLASRVRYETGGTVLTTRLALERGLACSTAGGTHHAFPDHGSGYCLLNDISVAAKYALTTAENVSKVLIVDLDVHQGDGTAFIFKGNSSVFTFSMHCSKNFPLRKEESDLDVEFEPGTGDKDYMRKLQEHLPWILNTFRPDLVIYDAGVDPHHKDDLGKLELSDQGLYRRDHYVIREAVSKGVPCAAVIGGGYSKNIDELSKRHTIVHRAASAVWKERGL